MQSYDTDTFFEKNIVDTHPVDIIEPLELPVNDYREAGLRFIGIMGLALEYILEQRDTKLATVGVIYALGLADLVEGKSMRTKSKELGVTCAALSYHAVRARKHLGLPPSLLQQSEDRCETARKVRLNKKA